MNNENNKLDPNSMEAINKRVDDWYNSSIKSNNSTVRAHKVVKQKRPPLSPEEARANKRVEDWFNGTSESNGNYNSPELMDDVRAEFYGGVPFGTDPNSEDEEPKSGFGGR